MFPLLKTASEKNRQNRFYSSHHHKKPSENFPHCGTSGMVFAIKIIDRETKTVNQLGKKPII
jgi:hypothetical protein